MYVFGSKRSQSRASRFGSPSASSTSSQPTPARPVARAGSGTPRASRSHLLFEARLLVAALPAEERERCIQRLLPLVEKRPPWNEQDVGDEPAEQCKYWWPLSSEKVAQQTPRGLQLVMLTELENGLRSMATPLWLLNRIVRGVWLLRLGRRVGQVYAELERQPGGSQQAREQVRQVFTML